MKLELCIQQTPL